MFDYFGLYTAEYRRSDAGEFVIVTVSPEEQYTIPRAAFEGGIKDETTPAGFIAAVKQAAGYADPAPATDAVDDPQPPIGVQRPVRRFFAEPADETPSDGVDN